MIYFESIIRKSTNYEGNPEDKELSNTFLILVIKGRPNHIYIHVFPDNLLIKELHPFIHIAICLNEMRGS